MSQIKVKQITGLQATINALSGIDNIAEVFTTSATNGDTGILITNSARETDAIQIHVNGQLIQEGFSWKKSGLIVTTDSLEAGTELIWDETVTGFSLEITDEIKIQYETESGGSVDLGSQPATNYDDTAITGRVTTLENAPAGTSGTSGTSGINGNDGTSGSSGINGTSGSNGANGIDGTDGTSGSSGTSGGGGASGVISSHLIPDATEVYDIGSATYKIRHLFLSSNSLNIGDQPVTLQDGKIHLPSLKIGDELEFTTGEEFAKTQMSRTSNRIQNLYANKISKACTPIWIQKNDGDTGFYVGSGQFVSLNSDLDGNPTDLAEGYLLTCAHNLEKEAGTGQHHRIRFNHGGKWHEAAWKGAGQSYIDGIADVAIIRTGILQNANEVLKLATVEPVSGQMVWICGFPGGYDTDSITSGYIRDAHFNINDGAQSCDTLFISASGIGGNSGSAILDNNGDIVGIFTFAYTAYETFGGGANLATINKVLINHSLGTPRNLTKKFIGITWQRVSPFEMDTYYPATGIGGGAIIEQLPLSQGCKITSIHTQSPFFNAFQVGDIIIKAAVPTTSDEWILGFQNDQFTPGILQYLYDIPTIDITRVNTSKVKQIISVNLNVMFADVPLEFDTYLSGGANIVAEANLISEGI